MSDNEQRLEVAGTTEALRTFEQTTSAGTVQTEAVSIVDHSNVDEIARVRGKRLLVEGEARITRHGSQASDARFIDVSANFSSSVPSSKVVTVSGDAPSQTGSKGVFSNGSWRSLDNCRYREGRTTELTNTAAFTGTPAVGEYALIGVGNATGTTGFLYGSLDGEDVFIFRKNSVNERVLTHTTDATTNEWDDLLDGTGLFTDNWDRSTANVWALSFLWHGNGAAALDIAGVGRESYQPAATLQLANNRTDASLDDPDVYVWIESSANMAVEVSSWALGAYLPARDNVISQGNSYSGTIAPGGEFIGEWVDLADFAQFNTIIQSDQALVMDHEYSADGVTPFSGTVPTFMHTGDGNARRFQLGIYARYVRLHLTNNTGSTANVATQAILLPTESRLSIHRTGDNLTSDRSAEVVKAVVSAQQPDTDWINQKAAGAAYDIDGNIIETTTPLGAGGVYESGWMDTDGWAEIEILINADQVSAADGIEIEHSYDVSATTPAIQATETLTYSADSVSAGFLRVVIGVAGDGFRVRYTNGGTPQGSFFLGATARPVASATGSVSVAENINNTSQATVSRGPIDAQDDGGIWGKIKRTINNALRISVFEHETDTPIRAANSWAVTKVTATTTPAALPSSPLANRISIEIHNADNNRTLWMGTSSATVNAGQYRALSPGESIILELDETVSPWIRTDSSTASVEIVEVADSTV